MISLQDKEYTCDVCSKTFHKLRNFRAHQRRHVVPIAHSCKTCGDVFLDSAMLKQHQTLHSASETMSQCDVCQKLFTRKSTLESHMRLHTRDKKYQCTICGKCNGTKHDLECHLRTHTGEKPYKCDTCHPPACFSTRSSLTRHIRTHSGYQPHDCKFCGQTFCRKDQYNRHMTKHLEYHCLSCGTVFKTYVKYSKHLSTCKAGLDAVQEQDISNRSNKIITKPTVSDGCLIAGNPMIPNSFYKDGTSDFYANSTIQPILQFSQIQSTINPGIFNDSNADEIPQHGRFKRCAPSNIVHVMVEQDPIESDVESGS